MSAVMIALTMIIPSGALAWGNGGYSSDPQNPAHGTHDWIADMALMGQPNDVTFLTTTYHSSYLLGTEAPDNPAYIGDTFNHHVYIDSTMLVQDDASAARADQAYHLAFGCLLAEDLEEAAYHIGAMTHYIADVGVFGHTMGTGTDWGAEVHHSDYESAVESMIGSLGPAMGLPLGDLDAYSATIALAEIVTFGDGTIMPNIWMDANYNWADATFAASAEASLYASVASVEAVINHLMASTQDDWINTNPLPAPSARHSAGMAYDSQSDQFVIFGGYAPEVVRDTWSYDLAANMWKPMQPLNSPSERFGTNMAYDSQSDRVILFSGACPYADTWSYDFDTDTWTNLNPVMSPSARSNSGMAYDSQSDRIILFGGQYNQIYPGDTWAFDFESNTWTDMRPATAPTARNAPAMTYDSQSDRIILYGGFTGEYVSETWAYDFDSNTWTKMNPTSAPPARFHLPMVYDSSADRSVLFGGYTTWTWYGDTWAYDFDTDSWENMNPASAPSARGGHAMVYDSDSHKIILFGGAVQGYPNGETWVYDYPDAEANTPPIASVAVSPSEGSTSTPFVLDASASSDVEDPVESLMVRWDWEGDGVFDTDWSTDKLATHTYSEAGNYVPAAEVKDTGGLSSTATAEILVRPVAINALVDFEPSALNPKSMGKWLTAYIELPEGYDVNDIRVDTVELNSRFPAAGPWEIGDFDEDETQDLMVKFDRFKLFRSDEIPAGETLTLMVSGSLQNGTGFQGTDEVKVVPAPHKSSELASPLDVSLGIGVSTLVLLGSIGLVLPGLVPRRRDKEAP